MGAQQGRPYCRKAGAYILPEDWEPSNLHSQCRECAYIIYIGCPGFVGSTKADEAVYHYIKWARGEPVPDDSPIFQSCKEKASENE